MHRSWLVAACGAAVALAQSPPLATVTYNATTPVQADLNPQYLSFNIDTASIYNGMNFLNEGLINIVKQLTPASIRIGGTAADSLIYTGASGPCGGNGNGFTLLNNSCFDAIAQFQAATGALILFDLPRQTDANGTYDPTINATELWSYVQSSGANIFAWQVGNELSAPAAQYGADFVLFKKTLSGYKTGHTVIGPSSCCNPQSWVAEFMNASRGGIDAFSMHNYPLGSCQVSTYLTLSSFDLHGALEPFVVTRNQVAPGLPLILEETATQSGGGCANLSDR
jgi:hypothetical protein